MDFEVSAELVGIYLEDAREHLAALDDALLKLESHGLDPEVAGSLLGPLHTLKGNSGMIGLIGVKDYIHRLEDAFAKRLRDQFVQANGQAAWQQDLSTRAQTLYDNLRREKGKRFSRPGGLGKGYDTKQVDELLERLTTFFDTGAPIVADDIRTAAFARRIKPRAYDEDEVDAYLAQAVDILQGVS